MIRHNHVIAYNQDNKEIFNRLDNCDNGQGKYLEADKLAVRRKSIIKTFILSDGKICMGNQEKGFLR